MVHLIFDLRNRWNRLREYFTCWLNPPYARFREIQQQNSEHVETISLYVKRLAEFQGTLANQKEETEKYRLHSESYAHDLVEAESQNKTMECENTELRQRISTQDVLLSNLQSAVTLADSRTVAAETRADHYHTELIVALKTESNWLASGLANRTIHPDAPLPDRPAAPTYRNQDGTPMELPGRGVRIRKATKRADAKVEEIIGKGRADFEKWAAEHESEFYNPETLTSEEELPLLDRLKKVMGEA